MTTSNNDDPHRLTSAEVVVGVDGSEASDLAVRWAAETASQRQRRLRIVHGLDLASIGALPGVLEKIRRRGQDYVLTAQRLAHRVDSALTVETEVSQANPAQLLIHRSEAAHLVAIGAAGTAGTLTHLGSTLLAVTNHGHGAIVVVRDASTEQQTRDIGPVVVGVDGSPVSEAAVAVAFAEADERKTQLVAVHACGELYLDIFIPLPDIRSDRDIENAGQALLAGQLTTWHAKYPNVHVIRKVYLSGPRRPLLDWSKSARLLVVGSRGRGGFRGLLLGSTSNALVQTAQCPVMVVHPQ
ncbi:universal stress protein [Nocardia vinacea]|uniref:universal stress protein n=1 Tax=Nocardia vinacea TaxID=96468 RepID=UPI002E104805|nr:universal stress protein [Nocardia vinacea]